MELKERVKGEIENFILHYTSYDNERQKMIKCLEEFMREVYEDENERI